MEYGSPRMDRKPGDKDASCGIQMLQAVLLEEVWTPSALWA